MEGFLYQAVIYLGAGVIAVPLSVRLGLGSVLGYLIAGIAIGPILGLVGSEAEDLQHFAELGVVLMLFLIGLELEPRALWDMRHRLLGLGGMQVLLTMAALTAVAMTLALAWPTALAVGMILALSSTAIVLQTLSEKGLMQTNGGRSIFSVLLTQDIAVIPMLAVIPLLAVRPVTQQENGGAPAESHGAEGGPGAAIAAIETLPAWGVTLVTIGAVAAVILFGIFATRPLFRFVHAAKLRELYVGFALLIVVGIAFLMSVVGLSPALGTFLAGVVLANSEFRHELESDIEPFKGLLLGLFFITVGAGINFSFLLSDPITIVCLALALMLIKGLILYGLAVAGGMQGRNRWLFTLGLAQAGEFGFVLLSFSSQQGVVTGALEQTLLLVIALSMLLTPLFFIVFEWMSKRMEAHEEEQEADEIDEQGEVIIAGVGRFGQVVNRVVRLAGFKTTVLDHDLETIELMRRFGFKGFFGDPTRPELLHAAGLTSAKVLVVAMDDPKKVVQVVRFVRKERPDIRIVARARDRVNVYQLYKAGADNIVRDMFDSSLRAGRYVLENMGLTEFEASELEHFFFRKDREGLRDLARLWDPAKPVSENQPYIDRAVELNRELETAMVEKFEDDDEDDDEDGAETSGDDANADRGAEASDDDASEPPRKVS